MSSEMLRSTLEEGEYDCVIALGDCAIERPIHPLDHKTRVYLSEKRALQALYDSGVEELSTVSEGNVVVIFSVSEVCLDGLRIAVKRRAAFSNDDEQVMRLVVAKSMQPYVSLKSLDTLRIRFIEDNSS